MIGDAFNKVMTTQSVLTTAVSSSSIDMLARRDIGPGTDVYMMFRTTTAVVPVHNAASVTNTAANPGVFTLASHGMTTGTAVVLDGGSAITGITFGTVYYVVVISANTFQLVDTRAKALTATTGIDTTGGATTGGTLTVVPTVEFQIVTGDAATLASSITPLQVVGTSGPILYGVKKRIASIDTSADTMTIVGHGMANGAKITFTGGGTYPTVTTGAGVVLASGGVLYVSNATADTFQVATTKERALAGLYEDITGSVSGAVLVQPDTVIQSTTANPTFVEANSLGASVGRRYLGARVVINGDLGGTMLSAGAFSAQIALNSLELNKPYPQGILWPVA